MFQTGRTCVHMSSGTVEGEGILSARLPEETGTGLFGGMRPEPHLLGHSLLSALPPPPLQPLTDPHLQVLRWGQQDPGHIQSHVPLSQNHSCVTAQIRCQLEEKGLDSMSLSLALVRLVSSADT